MKRLIILAALLAACSQAQAGIRCGGGPIRKAAANVRAKFEGRPIRAAACSVASVPAKIVEAAPVRSVVRECVNGVCPEK